MKVNSDLLNDKLVKPSQCPFVSTVHTHDFNCFSKGRYSYYSYSNCINENMEA